jgi:site-specific recombinase XerD
MYLSRNKKSSIYYIYFRKEDGKKTRYSTRTKYKHEALKFLNDFEKRYKHSIQHPSFTMNDLFKKYLNAIEITHTKQSYRLSRHCLEKFIEFVGSGDFEVKDVTRPLAESFILNTYQRAKHSAALKLRHLKAVFSRAIDWGYIEKNPFKGIKLSIPENNPVFINKKELELIVSKEPNQTLALLYRFAFYSGMRLSEITHLTFESDVNIKAKLIHVKNKDSFTTKSKRERVIPISKSLKKILKSVKGKEGLVFSNNGSRFKPDYVSKSFKKCVLASGLNNKIHFHSTRHAFASNLAQKGVSLTVIQKLLGHSKITTTQIYSHLRNEDLVKAIKVLD